MKVITQLDENPVIPNAVLTIGTFDGVHIGHQKIINQLNTLAKQNGGESVLFTFFPHPRMVIFPESHGLKLIQTQEEKLRKLSRMGLQNVIVYPFTKNFSRLSGTQFIRDFLVNKLNVKTIIIGYDHQFGRNREGTLDLLNELSPVYGFDVVEIEAQDIDDVNVSSTKIRNAISNGDIATANNYLGEPFQITGKVVHGKQIGRTIGFPTANIEIGDKLKLLPKFGSYAVQCFLEDGSKHLGMLNIGYRPTLESPDTVQIEAHLFDFQQDLYGQNIIISILAYIREEQKFEDLEQLQQQLQKDEIWVRTTITNLD